VDKDCIYHQLRWFNLRDMSFMNRFSNLNVMYTVDKRNKYHPSVSPRYLSTSLKHNWYYLSFLCKFGKLNMFHQSIESHFNCIQNFLDKFFHLFSSCNLDITHIFHFHAIFGYLNTHQLYIFLNLLGMYREGMLRMYHLSAELSYQSMVKLHKFNH
jgi:hypothetical protein